QRPGRERPSPPPPPGPSPGPSSHGQRRSGTAEPGESRMTQRPAPHHLPAAIGALALLALCTDPLLAQQAAQAAREYGDFPVIGSRAAVWIAAQVHLMFARSEEHTSELQ